MKNTIVLIASAMLAYATSQVCGCGCKANGTNSRKEEIISFYDVPLVCGAAPEIGCGSRAKPILLEMEQNPSIKEAWLNRTGTVYAIVWASADKTEETAKPIFEKYKVSFKKLSNKEAKKISPTFRETDKWYRGADVDKLSVEEAAVIANDFVNPVLKEQIITEEEADSIRPQIEAYFKEELVKTWSYETLKDEKTYKIWQDVVKEIYIKHIGEERAAKVGELLRKQQECKLQKKETCCTKGKKNSCCKNPKNQL